ncbi:hypothetical protein [Streptomyces violaceusniger]|uniref:Uncharacterized protein n=1 Tax=Streptomyces violaceusniger (strain Tu 4113) TaxID=653045 RepID=G2PHU4_STRV4|nr:hypothetical protein [Streptomyces violaceusniger]AEM88895.1 hypothetical protein Strvi_0119 [Streptomyces violaceusniger Tu 4113]
MIDSPLCDVYTTYLAALIAAEHLLIFCRALLPLLCAALLLNRKLA